MTTVLREHLTKTCALLLLVAAGVCAVMLLPTNHSLDAPVPRRFLPRYLFEKEIRGPDYHVVKRIFKNDGFTSIVKSKTPAGRTPSIGKFLLRSRRALKEQGVSRRPHTAQRKVRLVPAYPQPHHHMAGVLQHPQRLTEIVNV